ncbi:MAG: hypothetical protein JRI97_01555 [Deltaproteobacteria bacterium]|nr:hypothetical protein [Deltaproteobacteria bacterium]
MGHTNDTNRPERRRHRRFAAPEGNFAALRSMPEKVGPIINVSLSGLAFDYVVDACSCQPAGDFVGEIDIYSQDRRFALRGLPCCIVRDGKKTDEQSCFSSTIDIRRCAVRFKPLEGKEAQALQEFLSRCEEVAAAGAAAG